MIIGWDKKNNQYIALYHNVRLAENQWEITDKFTDQVRMVKAELHDAIIAVEEVEIETLHRLGRKVEFKISPTTGPGMIQVGDTTIVRVDAYEPGIKNKGN